MGETELVRSLIADERDDPRSLAAVLDRLDERAPSPVYGFLRIKEAEDRARVAHTDRSVWHRQLSWRLVRAVFLFGVASGALFVIFGDERTIEPAIWFVGGGAGFYLCAQIVTLGRARADDRGLRSARDRARGALDELETSLDG